MTALAAIGAAVALLGSAPQAPAKDPWAKLRRPLHIPRIANDAPCPVTPAHRVSPDFAPAQGSGPVYPVGAFPTFGFIYPTTPAQESWYPSKWSGNKLLWVARPHFRGPVLIRGRQLDGPNELRFEDGVNPAREFRLRGIGGSTPSGWQNRPSYTRLRAPGCYGWQIDGATFSRVIVFRAIVF
ncbi:MAG TPA: hypothetical protein VF066_18750 [Thermoleophilaceae bacterium]